MGQDRVNVELESTKPAAASWPRARVAERLWLSAVAVAAFGLIAASAALRPNAEGVGTATQLGLPPCAALELAGKPCPTCGMTTAFSLVAHGRVVDGFLAQPLGALLFFIVLFAGVASAFFAAVGRSPTPFLARIKWAWVLIGLVTAGLLSWAYKWSQF